jgi:hypothetical protein
MNTAPDSVDAGWSDKVSAFFTFGPGYTTGTYILVALGFLLFVLALIAWVYTEDQKLNLQAEKLRTQGLRTESMPAVAQSAGAGIVAPAAPRQSGEE